MAIRVLIVDDSPAMRTFIIRVFKLSGLEIEECLQACNGQDALELLKDHSVDIILTDVNMPTMNGEEFLQNLYEDERLRTIPVLVVSTDGSEHRVQRMMSLSAKGYLRKPFSPEHLREKMEDLLGMPHE